MAAPVQDQALHELQALVLAVRQLLAVYAGQHAPEASAQGVPEAVAACKQRLIALREAVDSLNKSSLQQDAGEVMAGAVVWSKWPKC